MVNVSQLRAYKNIFTRKTTQTKNKHKILYFRIGDGVGDSGSLWSSHLLPQVPLLHLDHGVPLALLVGDLRAHCGVRPQQLHHVRRPSGLQVNVLC